MNLLQKEQTFLLKLSRSALKHIFKTNEELSVSLSEVPESLTEIKATFVTLTKKKKLRGCIGKVTPRNPIYKDILENTYAAAFGDIRFPQLREHELKDIKVEISILSKPKKLKYENPKELVQKLQKKKPGVIFQYGLNTATLLPQVWEKITKPEQFLETLCEKAGLETDVWKEKKVKIFTYSVFSFSE